MPSRACAWPLNAVKRGLACRLDALVLVPAALVYFAVAPGLHAATLVTWLACGGLIASMSGYVRRTSHEVAHFVDSLAAAIEHDYLERHVDPDLIAQVIINLLKNAAEASLGHAESGASRCAATVTAKAAR